jgi:hypothetical protein
MFVKISKEKFGKLLAILGDLYSSVKISNF